MKTGHFPSGDEHVEHDESASMPALSGRVLSSPARAARDTAAWIAQSYEVDPAFDDLGYGRWRGHSIRDVHEREPQALAAWLSDPHARAHGGESIDMLAARVRDALQRCLKRNMERSVVVTHAIVVKTAIALVRDEPLESVFRIDIAPLSFTRFMHDARSGWSILP